MGASPVPMAVGPLPGRAVFARPEPADPGFLADVVAGLSAARKTLPCKYFYDERGSALFDRICELPEYYPTRTESRILRRSGREMAEAVGSNVLLVEYGSGSSLKTRLLLDRLASPAAYVPVDISGEHLLRAARGIADAYPGLEVLPVVADFTAEFALPAPRRVPWRRVAYFPGSTLGNFPRGEAVALLARMSRAMGVGGGLLIGVDLRKDPAILRAAYNDRAGVTAAFNLNLLVRINRELGGDFDIDGFVHEAVWNDRDGRIEMTLISRRRQTVRVGGVVFFFAPGETILTEYSCKYTPEGFAAMAGEAGFRPARLWTDDRAWFGIQYCEVVGDQGPV